MTWLLTRNHSLVPRGHIWDHGPVVLSTTRRKTVSAYGKKQPLPEELHGGRNKFLAYKDMPSSISS